MPVSTTLEALLRRDRAVVLAGVVAVAALAWAYLFYLAWDMQRGVNLGPLQLDAGMAMSQVRPWSGVDFGLMFLMWAVMMVAMMTPSAAPMILLFAAIIRKRRGRTGQAASSAAFAAGYLAVWIGFSALATRLQWALEQAALLSPMMVSTSPYLGGGLLVAAGIYQWTPLKHACLQNCRAPAEFLSRSWRNGTGGAVAMGIHHGAYCVGCCWILMGLLFVGGVMNLLWVAAIAVFVLLEKVLPFGVLGGRVTGALLALAGLIVLFLA